MRKRDFLKFAGSAALGSGITIGMPTLVWARTKEVIDFERAEVDIYGPKGRKTGKITLFPGKSPMSYTAQIELKGKSSRRTVKSNGSTEAFKALRDRSELQLKISSGGKVVVQSATLTRNSEGLVNVVGSNDTSGGYQTQLFGVDDLAAVAIVAIVTVGIVAVTSIVALTVVATGGDASVSVEPDGVSVEIAGGGGEGEGD